MKPELHGARYVAIVLSAMSAVPGYAAAEDARAADSGLVEAAPPRNTLTGDWFGHGPAWRENGIDFRLEWSQYYQGLTQGDDDKSWKYGGHVDGLVRIDPSKFSSWEGLSVTAQVYWNYGESVNGSNGTLFPLNSALFFPNVDGSDTSAIVALNATQNIGDLWAISIGRFNNIDGIRYRPVFGGGGVDTFWNLNPAVTSSGLVPAGIHAASVSLKTQPVSYFLMIYDPVDAYSADLFENVFTNGVGVNGIATWKTSIAGKTGYYGLSGSYSGASLPNLGDIVIDTEVGQAINDNVSEKTGAWAFAFTWQQFIYQDPVDPTRGWGFFGAITESDANPTPLGNSFLIGVGGDGLFASRPDDRWGISYSRFGMSSVLKEEIAPLLADEWLIEGFYNFSITPWFRVTTDLQWIEPATNGFSKGLYAGLQTYIKF